jgi:hemoglobin
MTSSEAPTTHFELIGAEEGVRGLVDHFYDVMDTAPEAAGIRALHAKSLDTSRMKLRLFLTGWLGGPPVYVEQYGHPMLRARHLPFPIGEPEADAWVWCMDQALDEADIPTDLRNHLRMRFRAVADHMRNRAEGAD